MGSVSVGGYVFYIHLFPEGILSYKTNLEDV